MNWDSILFPAPNRKLNPDLFGDNLIWVPVYEKSKIPKNQEIEKSENFQYSKNINATDYGLQSPTLSKSKVGRL